MAKKISGIQAMCNTLICNIICASYDYRDGTISEDTFKYVVRQTCSAAINLPEKQSHEFRHHPTVEFYRNKYRAGA